MNFFDVIRRLVDTGPFASDEEREHARTAINEHEEQHDALTALAPVAAGAQTPGPDAGGHPYGDPGQ